MNEPKYKPLTFTEWVAAVCLWLVLVLLVLLVLVVLWGTGGCVPVSKPSIEAKVEHLVEAQADVQANVGALAGRVNTSEIKLRDLTADIEVNVKPQIGGTNDNVTTWIGIAGGPVCVLAYIFVWRPNRIARQAQKGQ